MMRHSAMDIVRAVHELHEELNPSPRPVSLYWVKWRSFIHHPQGFIEMQDMFRYTGDMPRRVHYTPPTEKDKLHGIFHIELISLDRKISLEQRAFARWNSFGAWTKYIDQINQPREHVTYKYSPNDTKALFERLQKENDMGMYADW